MLMNFIITHFGPMTLICWICHFYSLRTCCYCPIYDVGIYVELTRVHVILVWLQLILQLN